MDQDVQAARDKLAARFANQTQIGGKGKTAALSQRDRKASKVSP